MSENKHILGSFCWVELTTTDLASAKHFYSELFGWSTIEMPIQDGGGDHGVYTMFIKGEHQVGGLFQRTPEMAAQGVPPNWMGYVAVEDVAKSVAKAKELGATIIVPPMDVMEEGKMASIADPTGAVVSMWQALKHRGAGGFGQPGFLCWSELATRDTAASQTFYVKLFDWTATTKNMGDFLYTSWSHQHPFGGMMAMDENWGEVPPHWMQYFAVKDCKDTARRVEELGGNVCVPPTQIPEVGTFAVINDPQGATFSIIQLIPQEGCA